jgi:putative radical SAM-modified peptide
MQIENFVLEVLDEGRDVTEMAITCCPTGSNTKIK